MMNSLKTMGSVKKMSFVKIKRTISNDDFKLWKFLDISFIFFNFDTNLIQISNNLNSIIQKYFDRI